MRQATAIRPDEARLEYLRLMDEDRGRFVGADGRLRPADGVEVDCPACGDPNRQRYDPDGDPHYFACLTCGCVYASPRLRPELLEDLARGSASLNFFHKHILLPTEAARRDQVFAEPLALLQRRVARGRILELGSAVGTLLGMLGEAGYEPEGIELCRFSVEHNRSLGRRIHDQPIERLALPPKSYAGVVAWGVLCVLDDPRATIRAVFDALEPGGGLVLDASNARSFEYLTLGTRYMNPFVFCQYYTPEAMTRLLADAGFDRIEIETPGQTDVQTVRSMLGGPDPSLGHFLEHVLFDESDSAPATREALQRWIAEQGWSGHMVVTARKPT